MKILFSFLFMSFIFTASATTTEMTDVKAGDSVEFAYPGGPGKGRKKTGKRMNKKRKRKCAQWGRKSFAG